MADDQEAIEAGEGAVGAAPAVDVVGMATERLRSRGQTADPRLDAYLDKQTRLLDLQAEHLHEQRELTLSRLRWGRFSDRVRAALQVMTAAVALAAVLGFGWMAWRAHQDRSLIVEPFTTPPDLAQQGLGGQAFASLLLDRLAEMDSTANSGRSAASYANSWGEDAKVEIPETGVSIGELDRFLRSALGRQTRVTGEVFHRNGQLAVSVRSSGGPGVAITGAETDLDGLVQHTAEAIYGQTQPYRFSKYLEYQGRTDESREVARRLAVSNAPKAERAWGYTQLANLVPGPDRIADGVEDGRRAVALDPGLVGGWLNLASDDELLGHDSEAVEAFSRGVAAFDHDSRNMSPESRSTIRHRMAAPRADMSGDYGQAAAEWAALNAVPDFQMTHNYVYGSVATELAKNHDPSGARAARLKSPVGRDVDLLSYVARMAAPIFPEYEEAASRGDWAGALALLDKSYAAAGQAGLFANVTRARFLDPRRAVTLARLGRVAEAQAVIGPSPLDCYSCLLARGAVAREAGDQAGAARWFAEAARRDPTLPFADTERGRMLLERGDVDGAMAKLARAHAASPRFADPLELMGEAMMRKGDYAGAAARFRQAATLAPNWDLNRRRLAEALAREGGHG